MAKERLKSPRARLFVALDLPDEIREEVAAWQRRELTDPALRVTPPENLHITLAFLGWQAERDIDRIADALLIGPYPPAPALRFEPEPVAKGKSRRRPGLFALDAPSEDIATLHEEVADRLETAGVYEREKRPFWSHLTVARVKSERGSKQPRRVETYPGPLPRGVVHPFDAVRVSLYRSNLRPQGAEYVSLAQTELPRKTPDAARGE
jgi:2'-5' RNA ligase